jgi:hypothetical protein
MKKSKRALIQPAAGLHYLPKPKRQRAVARAGNGSSLMKRRDEMKKMKSWKQQLATVLGLALIVLNIVVCVPDQTFANGKGRRAASVNAWQRNNTSQRPQTGSKGLTAGTFGRGIIMANTEGDFHVKARRNRAAAGFLTTDPQGPTYNPLRRNSAGALHSSNGASNTYMEQEPLNARRRSARFSERTSGGRAMESINFGKIEFAKNRGK